MRTPAMKTIEDILAGKEELNYTAVDGTLIVTMKTNGASATHTLIDTSASHTHAWRTLEDIADELIAYGFSLFDGTASIDGTDLDEDDEWEARDDLKQAYIDLADDLFLVAVKQRAVALLGDIDIADEYRTAIVMLIDEANGTRDLALLSREIQAGMSTATDDGEWEALRAAYLASALATRALMEAESQQDELPC